MHRPPARPWMSTPDRSKGEVPVWQRRKVGTTHRRRRIAFLPRSRRWGTWHTELRGRAVHNAPFRIPAQALAQFSYPREAWLSFKTLIREFGGKPLETHPSHRHVGPRNMCLPVFRWQRQFAETGISSHRRRQNPPLRARTSGNGAPVRSSPSVLSRLRARSSEFHRRRLWLLDQAAV
jgi:hypothetical protein